MLYPDAPDDLDTIAVGDQVWQTSGNRRDEQLVIVEKIGPKLIHVATRPGGKTTAFFKGNFGRRDGYPGRIRTKARKAFEERRHNAYERLREHGVEIDWRRDQGWTVERLEALADMAARIHTTTDPAGFDTLNKRIEAALEVITRYGGIDGSHHKAWTLDQVVRALTGTETEYQQWRTVYEDGGNYEWDTGRAP